MSNWQWFFLGVFVAYTPCLLVLVILLWRAREGGWS
jgi:hypothetical protein